MNKMLYTLDDIPIPDDFRQQLKQKHKFMELVKTFNRFNFLENTKKLKEFFHSETRDQVEQFVIHFFEINPHNSIHAYHVSKCFYLLMSGLGEDVIPEPNFFASKFPPEYFAYLVRFGLYPYEAFRVQFAIHVEWRGELLVKLMMILGPILDRSEGEKLFFCCSNDNHIENDFIHNNLSRIRSVGSENIMFRMSGSFGHSIGSPNFEYSINDKKESEQFVYTVFRELLEKKFEVVTNILRLFSPHADIENIDDPISNVSNQNIDTETKSILVAFIKDDVEWVQANIDLSQVSTLGNHEYEYLNSYFRIHSNTSLLKLATLFNSKQIIEYLIQYETFFKQMNKCVSDIIYKEDFELIKLFGDHILFTSADFIRSLQSTNLKIVNYMFTHCVGKSFLFETFINSLYSPNISPSSMVFCVQIVFSLQFFIMKSHVFDYSKENVLDFLSLFLLFHLPITHSKNFYFYVLDQLINANREPIAREFLKRYKRFIGWNNLVHLRGNIGGGRLLEIMHEECGSIPISELAKIGFKAVLSTSESAIKSIIALGGTEVLNQVDKDGFSLLHVIILRTPLSVVIRAMKTPGLDVNSNNNPGQFTILHVAAYRGDRQICKEVLSHPNIDVNALDGYNRTPISCATNPQIIKEIFSKGGRFSKNQALNAFREKDFIRSNPSYFELTTRGTPHNTPPVFVSRCGKSGWNFYTCKSDEFSICQLLVRGKCVGDHFNDTENCDVGTKTRTLIAGPFGFGGGVSKKNDQDYSISGGRMSFGGLAKNVMI